MKKHNRKNLRTIEKKADSSDWMISYSDVVTVLLCFFIIFYAAKQKFSSVKQDEMEAIVELLSNSKIAADEVKKYQKRAFGSAQEGSGSGSGDGTGEYASGVERYIQRQVERRAVMNEVKSTINMQLANKDINLISEGNRVHVQFDRIEFFAFGSSKLTQQGREMIDSLIKIIAPHKEKIFINIEGYSDPTPVKRIVKGRKWNTNLELSLQRSLEVNKYFLNKGFNKYQMAVSGYGSNRPLTIEELTQGGRNVASEAKAAQRRVSISLSAK